MLKLVRIPEPERRMGSYPHEMSGGQRQRVMIAMALANDPELLIADEPTTALDVTIQAEILELMAGLQKRLGMGMMFITHDLNIVRRIAHRVYVMRYGEVVEEGDTKTIFAKPKHPYTKPCLRPSRPAARRRRPPTRPDSRWHRCAGHVQDRRRLPCGPTHPAQGRRPRVGDLRQGQTIGIVGESGSGKSTLARALLRLLPSEGAINFEGSDIASLDKEAMRPLRKQLQVVLQDPFGSLSARA